MEPGDDMGNWLDAVPVIRQALAAMSDAKSFGSQGDDDAGFSVSYKLEKAMQSCVAYLRSKETKDA